MRIPERYPLLRLMMVVSSFAPLFVFWAIQGQGLIPETVFTVSCALAVSVPLIFILLRIHAARRVEGPVELSIGTAEDGRDHLLIYLFAMLLPFYAPNLLSWRSLASLFAAITFVLFVFWYLNLHYINVLFALAGYRVYTVRPPDDGNKISGRSPVVLLTKRPCLDGIERLYAIALSDTVYLEYEEEHPK